MGVWQSSTTAQVKGRSTSTQGFELVPVTLEVGDYVLSPALVVERKALPDLHSSLASGRCGGHGRVACLAAVLGPAGWWL